jgi:hypothetical protein
MKKHVAKKLSLSRETLHNLTRSSLAGVGGALAVEVGGVDKNLSIPVCTNVISDCLSCTTPLASCPPSMQTYCTCA